MSEKRKMNKSIYIRLPDDLYEKLSKTAESKNVSMTDYVRNKLFSDDELISIKSTSVRKKKLPEDELLLRNLIGFLGEATGANIQLAKTIREVGYEKQNVEDLITEYRRIGLALLDYIKSRK